ncbi:hypothetical protein JXB28_05725 [Candidatus Woesearchaeota archaeon]|nr:hypothetical protein [Candidatus Woesearchaeota archaeon]
MRRSYSDVEIIKSGDGKIIGANLGFDFCAEHEWGIKGLYRDFGMKLEEELGFESRKNTLVPKSLFYIQKQKSSALIYNSYASRPDDLEHLLKGELDFDYLISSNPDKAIAAAWDERSFGLHVPAKHNEVPKMLYEAFESKNGIIMLSGRRNPFANSGLLLLDYTKIPEENKAQARADDKAGREEQALYRKMEQDSGVFELLKQSGKSFYSLGIRRLDKEGKPMWWLNPCEQQKYESGWYTTEQLKEWAEDKGPVMEKRKY